MAEVEDFLARTKNAPAGGALGDFLQRTKGIGPVAPPDVGYYDPVAGADVPSQTGAADISFPGLRGAAQRIGGAAAQAYEDTPPILTPRGQQLVDQMGVLGPTIYNPLLHILGGVPAAYNALAAGTGQAIGEAGSPALGRDVYAASQFLPALVGMGAAHQAGMAGAGLRSLVTKPPPEV